MDKQRIRKDDIGGLGSEAAFAGGPRRTVRSDPIAISGFPTDEPATGGFRVIPFVFPHAFDQYAHWD